MSDFGEDWDAQKMLDLYIYDYMKRKNMRSAAEIFAQEANVHDTPAVAEGFLTDWWSIFYDTYCSRMNMKSKTVGESSSSSSTQFNNVMENAHHVIHEVAPMPLPDVNHQATPQVPVGADLDPMVMGQQAPMQMPAVNHQPGPQVPVGADMDTMMMGQQAPMQMPDVNHQLAPQAPVGADFGAMMMGQQAPMQMPAVNHQPDPQGPAGADLDTMMMGQQPNPNQLSRATQLALLQAQAKARVQVQAMDEARAREEQAQAQARARASSSNASSQQLQALMMAAQSHQQVPSSGNRHGVSMGRSMAAPGAARYGASPRVNQPYFDEAGKNKGIVPQSPSGVPSISAFGNSSKSTGNQIVNPFSEGSQQLNPLSLNQLLDPSNSSAPVPENPLNRSTNNAQTVVIGNENSSGHDGQAFGNSPVLTVLNPFTVGSQQRNPSAVNQQTQSSISSAQIPANYPLQGITSSADQTVMLGNENLSGQDAQGFGNSTSSIFYQILNSSSVGSQQSSFAMNQPPSSSNSLAQMPANPLPRSTSRAHVIPGNESSSRQAGQGQFGNLDLSPNLKRGRDTEMNVDKTPTAKNQMVIPGQQGPKQPIRRTQTRSQPKKFQRKKNSSSTAVDKDNSLVDVVIALDKEDEVDSFLSQPDAADDGTSNSFSNLNISSSANNSNESQGFSFKEVSCFCLSSAKVLCCNFSSDGKYLASAGHEKKVIICNMESLSHDVIPEGHANIITDVRFRAVSTIFATSSFDKTVQIWNTPKRKSVLTLYGHLEQVMSVDFHPRKYDLLSSCDAANEIRLWDANQNACISVFKGASRQVRFQPTGNLLAAASGNSVSLIDIDSKETHFKLEGHANNIRSICWEPTGNYIASVSEDSARIWSTVGGGKCVYELLSNGNKFESCVFHPGHSQLLVIGSYQIIDLWNPLKGDKTMSIEAHEGIISSLAESPLTERIASASHDQKVKVWE